jgi:hypothetical protein
MVEQDGAFERRYVASLKSELASKASLQRIFTAYAGEDGARLVLGLLLTTSWWDEKVKAELKPGKISRGRERKLARQKLKRHPVFSGIFPVEWDLLPAGAPLQMRLWRHQQQLTGKRVYEGDATWLAELRRIERRRPGGYNAGIRAIGIQSLAEDIEKWTGQRPGAVRFATLLNAANRAAGGPAFGGLLATTVAHILGRRDRVPEKSR